MDLWTISRSVAISRLGEEALHGTVLSLHSFGTTFSFPHIVAFLYPSIHRDSASSRNKPRSSRRLDTPMFLLQNHHLVKNIPYVCFASCRSKFSTKKMFTAKNQFFISFG